MICSLLFLKKKRTKRKNLPKKLRFFSCKPENPPTESEAKGSFAQKFLFSVPFFFTKKKGTKGGWS
jgi:hypothetical protein